MPEPDARDDAVPNDLFGSLPTARSPLANLHARSTPTPGSRRALREAAERDAAAREAVARHAAERHGVEHPAPQQQPVPQAEPVSQAEPEPVPVQPTPAQPVAEQPAVEQPDEEQPDEEQPGSLNALFAPEQHHHVSKKKRSRGCLVGLLIVLIVLGGIAAGGIWVWNQYGEQISDVMGWGPPKDYEAGIASGEALVTIKSGDTGEPVSTALFNAGVTKTESVFYDYLISEGKAVTFYPGVYQLQQKMTAAAALEALEDSANRMENTVRVSEGGTVASTLPQIVDGVGIPLEELQAAVKNPAEYGVQAQSLEGWLFPAVYTFDPGATAKDVVGAMVARTQKSLDEVGVTAADAQRVLTIASIVQREGHTDDFDKVSRVIENRLDPANDETHGLLQMDSTAQYGYGRTHDGAVSSWPWEAVVNDQNPWNTYAHTGLPETPISNPSEAAIRAAQNPADGPWFYFVTVNLDTGETVFSATYAEQQAAEAEYQKWCEKNPDGGCY